MVRYGLYCIHGSIAVDEVLCKRLTVRVYLSMFKHLYLFNIFICFDQLVLDPATKKTVQALVSSHTRDRETFDDIVKGKGQGLVCVLHGPPGVGKVS